MLEATHPNDHWCSAVADWNCTDELHQLLLLPSTPGTNRCFQCHCLHLSHVNASVKKQTIVRFRSIEKINNNKKRHVLTEPSSPDIRDYRPHTSTICVHKGKPGCSWTSSEPGLLVHVAESLRRTLCSAAAKSCLLSASAHYVPVLLPISNLTAWWTAMPSLSCCSCRILQPNVPTRVQHWCITCTGALLALVHCQHCCIACTGVLSAVVQYILQHQHQHWNNTKWYITYTDTLPALVQHRVVHYQYWYSTWLHPQKWFHL